MIDFFGTNELSNPNPNPNPDPNARHTLGQGGCMGSPRKVWVGIPQIDAAGADFDKDTSWTSWVHCSPLPNRRDILYSKIK